MVNATRGEILAGRVEPALFFWRRLRGLLGRRSLSPGEGLLLEPCRSVHTFFMRFPIDVVFYDGAGRVVAVFPALSPFRCTPFIRSARGVIELPAGTLARTLTRAGDLLQFEEY
ncbi:MAG: DUF192 domain-containing protein [Bacillota bacterium]